MIGFRIALRSATNAPIERARPARSGRRSLIALLAVGGGCCVIAGAALPWLTVYEGLDSYSGIAGANGQMLAAGGAAAALLGLVYCIRAAALVRYVIGGLGFLLALFSAYLVAQLLSVYKQLHGIYLPELGPGVFLAAGGAFLILSTLFIGTDSDIRSVAHTRGEQRGSLAPATVSLVALSSAAGTIHLTVAADHFREYFLFGLFFVAVGVAQIAWAAIVAIAGPATHLLMLSLGNTLIVMLWIASRTTGVPLGPNRGLAERVGYADVATTMFEVLVVLLAVAMLTRDSATVWRRNRGLWSIPVLITPLTVLAVLSAVGAIGFLPPSG